MKARLVILAVLALGLLVSFPVILMAQATTTVVSGVGDFSDGFAPAEAGFLRWIDSGGWTHFNNLVARGNFTLTGEGIDIAGKWEVLFSVFIFDTNSGHGRVSGPFTVNTEIEGEETVLWTGHYVGEQTSHFISGNMWAAGSGPFERKMLEFNFYEDYAAQTEDNPDPDIFILNGVVTEPPPPPPPQ